MLARCVFLLLVSTIAGEVEKCGFFSSVPLLLDGEKKFFFRGLSVMLVRSLAR